MTLERIDQYIKELDAIKYYDEAKKERDQALQKVKELERVLTTERESLQSLSKERGTLEQKLKKKDEETSSLRDVLKLKDAELQKLELKVDDLTRRIGELENLKVTVEGKTLSEAGKAFLEAKEQEVARRANETFNSMKKEWTMSEKPKEVLNEAINQLKNVVEVLGRPKPRYFPQKILDAGLPGKVEEILEWEVGRRVDVEFTRKVEEKSNQKALDKLNYLKSTEWPNWLRVNVDPKVTALERMFTTNALSFLGEPWFITCDKCRTTQNIKFTASSVEAMLRTGYAHIECANLNCRDWFARHMIEVTLRSLIEAKMTTAPPSG